MITARELVDILDRFRREPLTPVELLRLFDPAAQDQLWADSERRTKVLRAVIAAIEEESEYLLESGGSFSARDIHRGLRRVVEPLPDMTEVEHALNLLASPLINGVRADGKGGYHPGVPAESIAARLHSLAAVAALASSYSSELAAGL